MGDSWHVVLRDIMTILAAGTVISSALFAALVVWQLYRLAIELREESRPLLEAVADTVDTVRSTAKFVSSEAVPPAVTTVGLSAGAFRIVGGLTDFYRGLQRNQAKLPPTPPAPPPPSLKG